MICCRKYRVIINYYDKNNNNNFILFNRSVLSEAMIRWMFSRNDGKELETDYSSNEMFQHFLGLSKTTISRIVDLLPHVKLLLNGATSVVRQLQREMTLGIIVT